MNNAVTCLRECKEIRQCRAHSHGMLFSLCTVNLGFGNSREFKEAIVVRRRLSYQRRTTNRSRCNALWMLFINPPIKLFLVTVTDIFQNPILSARF